MRNAWLPVVTVIGLQVGGLLGRRGHHRDGLRLERRRPLRRRRDPGPRLPRRPVDDPHLRPDLPGGEPRGRHRLRLPQPADPVLLMATATTAAGTTPHAGRPESGASRGLWRDAGRPAAPQPAGARRPGLHRRSSCARPILAPVVAPVRPARGRVSRTGFKPPSAAAHHGHRPARAATSSAGSSTAPGSASSSGVVVGDHGAGHGRHRSGRSPAAFGGRVDAVLDAGHRRPARDPGHPARDRHRRLAGPRPAPDHARGRRRPTPRSSPGSCAAACWRCGSRTTSSRPGRSALGARRILLRHMLPNALTPLIVAATLALATAIIDVAGLGFLGLGPADPRTPEWGTMLTDARRVPTARRRGSSSSRALAIVDQRDRLQPPRRRAARVARPAARDDDAAARRSPPASRRCSGRGPASSGFRTHDGHDPRRQRRQLRARRRASASGSSASRAAARASRTSRSCGCCPSRPAGSKAARSSFDGQDLVELRRGGHARHPRPRHRDDLPGPDDQPEPGPDHRGADGRDDPGPPEDRRKPRRAGRADRAARAWSASREPETRLKSYPAPVLGRHAPARDDRDGARARAAADDRRRADDRPRRDDPGPGPRAAPRPDRRVAGRRSSSSPTTSASSPG